VKRENTKKGILLFLLKDFLNRHTVTSIADAIGVSRVGAWKSLKEMKSEKLVTLSPAGTGKTSTFTVALNWDNVLTQKNIETCLIEEALENQRWRSNFELLGQKVLFLIIYGSILHSPREANDIDIMCVVARKSAFKDVEKVLNNLQKTQLKHMHSLNFTEDEFRSELRKQNPVFIDAIRKGVVLFGQESFISFMKGVVK
jgi:predicted nucleotidyltransferase